MALSYLGRKMGVPALRQLASTPRRLASSSSQSPHQVQLRFLTPRVVANNGVRVAADAWNWKPLPHVDVDVARQRAEFKAGCEAVRKAMEEGERNRRLLWSCCAGVGMALLTIWHTTYAEWERGKYFRSMLE